MPWTTPSLGEVRRLTRDSITATLSGAVLIGNSVLRAMSDAMSGLAHLTLRYIAWVAKQLLPDTSEGEWLIRHANIWLPGGRKEATFAAGSVLFTGIKGIPVPSGTVVAGVVQYETTNQVMIGDGPTAAPARALTAGKAANADAGAQLSVMSAIAGVDGQAIVVTMEGGVDVEDLEDLRERVLFRIRKPPMGGSADDYVRWALRYPGVTRAWCSPLELGLGTVTVRVMMDELRADNQGLPTAEDLIAIRAYIDALRPTAVKDWFLVAPLLEPIDFTVKNLDADDEGTRAAIEASVAAMLAEKAAPAYAVNGVGQPAQTIYAEWVSEAISAAAGVNHFKLVMDDHPMPNNGSMAVLGTITWG
ncbi:MAG: baseplate J/gp47 family protein [Pseudolabrys sp.]